MLRFPQCDEGWITQVLGFPQLQHAIFRVSADEVLVRVVTDANHVFLMDLDRQKNNTSGITLSTQEPGNRKTTERKAGFVVGAAQVKLM